MLPNIFVMAPKKVLTKLSMKALKKDIVTMKKPAAHTSAAEGLTPEALEALETLSVAGSLNEKLNLLKASDLDAKEKLKLLNLNLSHQNGTN